MGAFLLSPPRLAPGVQVQDQDLSDADWADADVSDGVFVGCQVTAAAFANTVLQGAHFQRCRLVRCRFPHADLREAVFEDCVFSERQ
ncbi:MAG: pentapeptide repeat-containing protein, partial [Proteobacteria bacterium]|nr:pentapeptide repeat-containing protein [Pseudomonadota bacterium]